MMKVPIDSVRQLKESLHCLLANRLTYAKVLASTAKDRVLTEAEVEKVHQCIEDCIRITEAEFMVLLWKLESGQKE